jgi:hypothetical protein
MADPATRTLWRPVGENELRLIRRSGFRAFPPRLPEQPIFYTVLNFEYAEQIARDWNPKDPRHANVGFVTEFDVRIDVLDGYEPQQVGAECIVSSGCRLPSLIASTPQSWVKFESLLKPGMASVSRDSRLRRVRSP